MTTIDDTDYSFALCLTHDVDRPFKTPLHALYYTVAERDPTHLSTLQSDDRPYWQFETIMELESDLGVRSAFYFLNEPPVYTHRMRDIATLDTVIQSFGRYSVKDPDITAIVRQLDEDDWEIGLHGSYHTQTDPDRLQTETERIEDVVGHRVTGGRQHYLRLTVPETWHYYSELGLKYDASLGSRTESGFHYGYDIIRPFDDAFVVFPLTLMEQHLPDPETKFDDAWATCESLLDKASREQAVMSVLFHPRYFNDREFPGYKRLYRRLIQTAIDRGAWVGSPGAYYHQFLADLPHDSGKTDPVSLP